MKRVIENTWIEMPDGARLAARIILPDDAEARPVGAVLEYISNPACRAMVNSRSTMSRDDCTRGRGSACRSPRGSGRSSGRVPNL